MKLQGVFLFCCLAFVIFTFLPTSAVGRRNHRRCPQIECPGHQGCPNGPLRDEHGCALCECAPPPDCDQRRTCRKYCQHGFQTGEDGCPICRCHELEPMPVASPMAAAPAAAADQCPQVQCMNYCPRGREKDSRGCETCNCRPPLVRTDCPPVLCRNYCSFGRHVDDRGCETCTCNSRPVASQLPAGRTRVCRVCAMYCPHGFKQGDDGCPLCECNPAPKVCAVCRKWCEHGFKPGPDGCPLCECNPPPASVRTTQHECPKPTCMMFCLHGFKTDEHGCIKCECREAQSQQRSSRRSSRRGARSLVTTRCRPLQCHPSRHCAFGNVLDHRGCPTCACRDERPNTCSLPPQVGPCRAAITRWYFNPSTEGCETFIYGGCRGNNNNFETQEICSNYCTAQAGKTGNKEKKRDP